MATVLLAVLPGCSGDNDEPVCEPLVENGIQATMLEKPFTPKCGVAFPGQGSFSGGMEIQISTAVVECGSQIFGRGGWLAGKHIRMSVPTREPGTHDITSQFVFLDAQTTKHMNLEIPLEQTLVIDSVDADTVRGSVDLRAYYATATGTFAVKHCF